MARKPTPSVPLPGGLPVLGRGRHRDPSHGACFLEYTSLLAGEPFSDEPACVDRELAAVLRSANDVLADADRPRLLPLLGRAVGLVVPPPPGPLPDPSLADPAADEVWRRVVVPHARATVELHRAVSARFTAALGLDLTAAEQRACDGGREVGRLFWSLLDRPHPVPASQRADRLIARLDLLHTCYEQALAQSAGPVASRTVAECEVPSVPVQVTVTR